MRIPIVLAIDRNVIVPCGVAITSLFFNANEDTYYEVQILYEPSSLTLQDRDRIQDAFRNERHGEIAFVDVGQSFTEVQINGVFITAATFYRLLIPNLFPQYDKVIYADIDMIFQQDLSELFQDSLQNGELVAAALDLAVNDFYFRSDLPARIGKSEKDYFNAGFLVMNLKAMREEKIVDAFFEHTKIKYEQNDQDILNIVCNGRVQILPTRYNFQLNHFSNYMWGRKEIGTKFGDLFKKATLHYTWKHKPWNSLECVAADTWWHYYKMSPFYDDKFYFNRQYELIEASRNDYRKCSNDRLFRRILVNLKHKLWG